MLIKLLKNPFSGIGKGHPVFYKFCYEHYSYLIANNENGQFTNFIGELKLVLDPYNAWLKTQDKEVIEKEGSTDTVDEIVAAFVHYVTKNLFRDALYHLAEEPHLFNELYPNGVTEYEKITRSNTEILMNRVAAFCKTNITKLDKGRDVDTQKFLDNYKANRGTQVEGKGDVKDGSADGKALRKAVENQMHYTLIDLMGIHKKDLKQILKYYNTATLAKRPKKTNNPPTKNPPSSI
jgi:hypothetical protein